MPPINRLVFHIGVPKTGSSLLQKAMRNLRPHMRDRGVTYIDRNVFLAIPSYRAWAPYGKPGYSKDEFVEAFRGEVERKRRLGGRPTGTVLISNEAASGRARDFGVPFWPGARPGITEVVEALAPKSTEVVMYVRRQDRLLESLYMQRIHRGGTLAWEAHRDRTCLDERVDFAELIESVAAIPTVDRVGVKPFEIIQAGAPAFVADFLAVVDSGALVEYLRPAQLDPTNPSFTRPAWEAALRINPLLDRPDQPKKVRKFLNALFPPGEYPKAPLLTEAERHDLIERYRPQNERLFTKYLPAFPVDAYSTPEGTDKLRNHLDPIALPDEPLQPKRRLGKRLRAAAGAIRRELKD